LKFLLKLKKNLFKFESYLSQEKRTSLKPNDETKTSSCKAIVKSKSHNTVEKKSEEVINNNLIKISTNQLKFTTTRIGNCSKRDLKIENISNLLVQWKLATTFVKSNIKDEAFQFPDFNSKFQILRASSSTSIQFKFVPNQVRSFLKHMQVKFYNPDVHKNIQSVNFTLEAEAIDRTTQKKPSLKNSLLPQKTLNNIYVKNCFIEFSSCKTSILASKKVIVYNKDKHEHNIVLKTLNAPFIANRKLITITPRCHATIPIYFRSNKKGNFEASLVLKTDENEVITILLKAFCN